VSRKQNIAIFASVILIGSTYLLFQQVSRIFGDTLGWYIGLVLYWLIWCGAFTLWLIGKQNLRRIIRPRRLTLPVFLLLMIPIVGSLSYKLIPGMDYGQEKFWLALMVISTALGNGFFEEVLWRGAYMELFPKNILFRIFWPSIWFALWHYVPASVSPGGNVIALMIGSGMFGFYLSYLAWKTNTIWWCIVAHIIGGSIMVI